MAKGKDKTELIGRCGLYCGACDIYRAFIDKDEKKLTKMAKYFRCKPEQIRCHGCQNQNGDNWSSDCKIISCLNRNNYRYCYECSNTKTCDIFQKLNKRYKEIPSGNLKRLHTIGEKTWLREQMNEWSCPNCGAPFNYESTQCNVCGQELSKSDKKK